MSMGLKYVTHYRDGESKNVGPLLYTEGMDNLNAESKLLNRRYVVFGREEAGKE